jgi:hypothetical protein
MSKSFEPRFLCSKIHSSPHSCISKFYAIFWDFSQKFLPPESFIQFLILFLIHKSIRIDFLLLYWISAQEIVSARLPLFFSSPAAAPLLPPFLAQSARRLPLHTGRTLDLLGVLRLLMFLRNQLLQVLDRILQLGSLSLTHLELLISLMQLGLEVVDVALGSDQLILGVLQPGVGIIEEVRLYITAVVGPHQLIVQFLDMCLEAVLLLNELTVALLNVLDEAVLSRHLVVVLLQA